MPVVHLADGDLNYQLEGPAGAPVLVLSNSLGTDLGMWAAQMPAFTQHLRVLRYDTRGHGQSLVTPGSYSIEQLGRDLLALLDALDIPQASFCGLSMGGLIGQWLAIKEAAIPGLIGIAVLVSTRTRHPLIRSMLLNKAVLNVDKIHQRLEQGGHLAVFETRLLTATYWLSGTFFFSSAMNYALAKWIVVSPSGSEAFNAELGRMNLLSYPMIAIPSMIMLMAIFYYLWRTIHGLTGLKLEEIIAGAEQES